MKTAVILAAYGAANFEGALGLAAFERQCRQRFPSLPLRWAYTSSRQRERLALQGKKSDSLAKALLRLRYERFSAVAVQPLQLIPGSEYEELLETVESAANSAFLRCAVGKPLLQDSGDIPIFADLLMEYAADFYGSQECAVFMAHGAKHPAGALFGKLASELASRNERIFLGAMSSPPYIEDIMPRLAGRKTWLFPLLSVAGMHTLRDMAGDNPGSWKLAIEKAGSICVPVLRGLLENPSFADLWLDNLEKAISIL